MRAGGSGSAGHTWRRWANTSRRLTPFERAIALRPTDGSSLVNIASCYGGLQKFPEAIEAYRKAFAIQPSLVTRTLRQPRIWNDPRRPAAISQAAGEVFDKMKAQPEPSKKARAHRSQAFLEMYRGRYDLAIGELRQAIVITRTLGAPISEFRDRLILTRALDAKGRSREAGVELAAVDRLIARLSLGPEWLRILAGNPGAPRRRRSGTPCRRSHDEDQRGDDSRLDDESEHRAG